MGKKNSATASTSPIAELDDAVVWNRATLGVAAISSSTSYLTGQLQQIDQAAHRIAASLSAEISPTPTPKSFPNNRNSPRCHIWHTLRQSLRQTRDPQMLSILQKTISRHFQQRPVLPHLFPCLPHMDLRAEYLADAAKHQLEREFWDRIQQPANSCC